MTFQRNYLLNFTAWSKPCPSLYYPLPRKVRTFFFALPEMNGPLPAELKFRENADLTIYHVKLMQNTELEQKDFDI